MDFEEYMATTGIDEQTENSCAWEFYKELYKAGQQSKQEQINKALELLRQPMQGTVADLLSELEGILNDT